MLFRSALMQHARADTTMIAMQMPKAHASTNACCRAAMQGNQMPKQQRDATACHQCHFCARQTVAPLTLTPNAADHKPNPPTRLRKTPVRCARPDRLKALHRAAASSGGKEGWLEVRLFNTPNCLELPMQAVESVAFFDQYRQSNCPEFKGIKTNNSG